MILLLVPEENRREQGERAGATRHPWACFNTHPVLPPRAFSPKDHPKTLFLLVFCPLQALRATRELQTLAQLQPCSPFQRTRSWQNWVESSTELGLMPTNQAGKHTSHRIPECQG